MATIMRVGGGAGGGGSKNPSVSTLAEETILLITENGIPAEYYIAKHGYEPELNGPNRTLLVRKDLHSTMAWNTTAKNAYADSTVDDWLNGDFFNGLSSSVRDLLGVTTFYYTIGNGNFTVSTLTRAVFSLSVSELGFTYSGAKVEGSALPIANTLKIAYLNGTATSQWERSSYIGNNTYACFVTASGAQDANPVTNTHGIRPVFTIPSNAKVIGPDSMGRYTLEVEHVPDVYGIARDITAQSPAWVRTDGAMTFSATASVGTVAGQSDFDNIYPWSEMKRVTLDTGDVMVKIPKFYYGRYRNGNIERIQISGRADVGLTLHPAFNHAGVEQECIYVGAYKMGVGDCSKSGVAPVTGYNRAGMRMSARTKGTGWGLIDISTLSAIQMLYLVEFANNNSQQTVGRGYCDGNSAKINTGSCDTVPNLTGRPAGTDGKTDIVYRGIEGLWGNVLEWVDGMNAIADSKNTYVHYWICNDPSKYADDTTTGYTDSSYKGLTGWNANYITTVGLDANLPHTMLPEGYGASETTNYCDAVWANTNKRVYAYGGLWLDGSKCGLFATYLYHASSNTDRSIGSRLIYIPQ